MINYPILIVGTRFGASVARGCAHWQSFPSPYANGPVRLGRIRLPSPPPVIINPSSTMPRRTSPTEAPTTSQLGLQRVHKCTGFKTNKKVTNNAHGYRTCSSALQQKGPGGGKSHHPVFPICWVDYPPQSGLAQRPDPDTTLHQVQSSAVAWSWRTLPRGQTVCVKPSMTRSVLRTCRDLASHTQPTHLTF